MQSIQNASLVTAPVGSLISEKAHSANNFDFLRFLAASSVIWYHTPTFLGRGRDTLGSLTGGLDTGILAVAFFFVISGFLITQSFDRNNSVTSFVSNRFLRIWPPLAVITFLCTFCLGPLISEMSPTQYFSDFHVGKFMSNVFCLEVYHVLPGVFVHNHAVEVVNGSLWTIPVEVFMYAVTLTLGICGILKKKVALALVFIALLVCDMQIVSGATGGADKVLWLPPFQQTSKFALMYLMGANYYLNRSSIKISWKLALIALLLLVGSFHTPYARLIEIFSVPYLVMFAAYLPVPRLNNFGKYGDFSYGMYLYGFPVEQTLWLFSHGHISPFKFTAIALVVSFCLAFVSWHLVEKPSIGLKKIFKK